MECSLRTFLLVCLISAGADRLHLGVGAAAFKDDEALSGADQDDRDLNFFAARGRRGSSGATPDNFFWANRGKRGDADVLEDDLEDGGYDVDDNDNSNNRWYQVANTKNSLSARAGFNRPRISSRNIIPYGPLSYNAPRPNGFFFPSMGNGKRNFNLPKPNGFFFPTFKAGKRSDFSLALEADKDLHLDLRGLELVLCILHADLLSEAEVQACKATLEGASQDVDKRNNFDSATFFAGRGKRNIGDLWSMISGTQDLATLENELSSIGLANFMASFTDRGKKDKKVNNDIFFAGRGKKSLTES